MRSRDEYTFLSIRDAISSINQKVNLMGVVAEIGLSRQSKGPDCYCSLKIMDESYQGHGLLVNIFAENMEKLPDVKSAGDIIRLSQVVMKAHRGEVNALFNKKLSSFALFEGKSSVSYWPYQASSNFRIRDPYKESLTSLRTWLLNFQLDSGINKAIMLLREIKEGQCFDLVCKIVHVCEISKDAGMLFVWDGTDTPPLSCQKGLNDEWENPLPLQLEPLPLARDVTCTFPHVGTILRVMIDKPREKLGLHLPSSNKWAKFVSITCHERQGLWYGIFTASTKIRILSDEDINVIHRQRDHEKRLSSKWERMPLSSFPWPSRITETDSEHPPFVTLMDVLTYPKVTAKFKCVVRVVAICPWKIEQLRSPVETQLYRIRLTLEDPTARIHAFIFAENGSTAFSASNHPNFRSQKFPAESGVLI
ncbi:hypothetical protein GIB67_038447 [Kingdonia uniflora]|uniref:Telomeric single stranded DNA binding POT1/Cdc13 domain-containing protein n=1 Tax=Kingdonia uniflora TaxID=39325 RepID=A0A7J7NPH6_9MAGN|nr:hypothetical protein GIB67_038447 [Kingdonia uniflora]